MMEFSNNQSHNNEIYLQVKALMEQIITDENPDTMDAHVLATCIIPDINSGLGTLNASVVGSAKGLTQLLLCITEQPGSPDELKRAILVTAANLLSEMEDKEAKEIGKILGFFTDHFFGEMDCDCPRCTMRKKLLKNDINLN